MSKQRIVLETTGERKAALVSTLSLQGDTLSDWLEEQLELSVPPIERPLPRQSPTTVSDLSSSTKIIKKLKARDWAFTNDDTRYLTHDLHPYPAKFIPQIPAHLIAALSLPGDVVFDPFGGSATTAVEAVRLGRRALSLDANPLSELIGKVKTGFMTSAVRVEFDQLQAAIASHVTSSELGNPAWAAKMTAVHRGYVPAIPNIDNWFHPNVIAELALIRFLIDGTTSELGRDAALLALSRIVNRVSYQESETRYVAEPKDVLAGVTLRGFAESLKTIERRLGHAAAELQRADARFMIGDSRTFIAPEIGSATVDLIVTSPPYPNATDYHLYHRFRLFWLGFDPRKFGAIEIGSHLRHQRNGSGFEEYQSDMSKVLEGCYDVLKPGRYAVFVAGDSIFKGQDFSTSKAIVAAAKKVGFEFVGSIERPIHQTKRSFAKPARRARGEQLVILLKPDTKVRVKLFPPAYRMWEYEVSLRKMEIQQLTAAELGSADCRKPISVTASLKELDALRRLTFSSQYLVEGEHSVSQATWQKVLENGDAESPTRKDPKYATHGLHPYKGKFYPQLVKSLINISGIASGATILDPYCGSGTSLLEGMLNGFSAYGCDMHPLAAKIARAKTQIFSADRGVAEQALITLLNRVRRPPSTFPNTRNQFKSDVLGEIDRWFPSKVLNKLEWILGQIRLFGEPRLVEFAEVILSSVIRNVSQQDPTDLRIRRRKVELQDAPVLELFGDRLETQVGRLVKYWSIAGRQPGAIFSPVVGEGDSRSLETFTALGLEKGGVDCVVTSPPYATALPYIDTDRLSLMAIMGIDGGKRTDLESGLTGSREIRKAEKARLERDLVASTASDSLPKSTVTMLRKIYRANTENEVGFRRENMASLLWRYFLDMHSNISAVAKLLKPGARAFYVVGNSRTNAGGDWMTIDTCKHLSAIAEAAGLEARNLLNISVTTENFKHLKNAITENAVLEFRRPVAR